LSQVLSLAVSLIVLLVVYWQIDFSGLLVVLQNCSIIWLVISLGMVVPLTLLTAWRLQQLAPKSACLGFAEANRLILAACVLNMVLPSKMGDIAKAYFIKERGHLDGSLSLSLVVFEKVCDLLSLLLWCGFGLLLYPQKDWLFWLMTSSVVLGLGLGLLLSSPRRAQAFFTLGQQVAPQMLRAKLEKLQLAWGKTHCYFWSSPVQLAKVASLSLGIWFLHLLQIWLFIFALKAWAPFLANLALAPLALLAGLLPLTFAGVGTRDAALIAFYRPYFNASTAAALGLLCTSRYLLPAIAGLPFLGQYLPLLPARNAARTRRRQRW